MTSLRYLGPMHWGASASLAPGGTMTGETASLDDAVRFLWEPGRVNGDAQRLNGRSEWGERQDLPKS